MPATITDLQRHRNTDTPKAEWLSHVRASLTSVIERRQEDILDWCEQEGYGEWSAADAFEGFDAHAGQLFAKGFSTADAVSYLASTEEADPRIPEATALARMARIESTYK